MNGKYVFTIESDRAAGTKRTCADRLSITKSGDARLYIDGRLVSVAKSSHWVRITVEPDEQKPSA